MNEENKKPFGLVNITIGEGEDAIVLEAMGESIEIESKESENFSSFDFGKPIELVGNVDFSKEGKDLMNKMIQETVASIEKHIKELLQEIVDDFGITLENKKMARIETIIGAPAGDYSKIYVDNDLVAMYVPNKLPFRSAKFY